MLRQAITLLFVVLTAAIAPVTHAALPAHISQAVKTTSITPGQIELDIPPINQDGAVVPIKIKSVKVAGSKAYVEQVWFFEHKRPEHIAHFKLSPEASATGLATYIKLPETTTVYAIAKFSDGHVVSGDAKVKVTEGGCGGGG